MEGFSRKHKKRIELYLRCLSSVCIDSMLGYYYIPYEFHSSERWLRKGVMKKALADWKITDAASLKERIDFLLNDGHCQEYLDIHNRLSALTLKARERYLEDAKDDPDYKKMIVVGKWMGMLPSADIAALGGGWAILLSRIGRIYRFLSEEEAWEIKQKAAALLQQHYRSWDEYLTAFAAGTHFIKEDIAMKYSHHVISRASNILGGSKLAYNKVPWDLSLLPDKHASASMSASV
ncbi:DUF1266 domain-containing protein [Paenibacillus sp. FSL K6-1566]|uniref:DUF1266 domain-containing protein n=1 Tax=Paenibacillus sp. FSL K6-1566 TaxID=2954515 RepID=UPI0031016AA9